jgi:MFS transporter, ACS family, tartrate transporter
MSASHSLHPLHRSDAPMPATSEIEARTIRKVTARLIPFLVVCYFVAYLDRVNVGFAAITMNKELGLTASMFGFGAGVFFLAYFLFEVPSNLFLERFGARKWIARIMFSWGVLSGSMAFIPHLAAATGMRNEHVFYWVRVLLGIAEAGFFPGIIFYLTLWFPAVYRARIIGFFMAAIPLSSVIGAPISGMLLNLNGWHGLAGWQWMFIIESAPAIVLAVVTYFYLTDRPLDAKWLADDERWWLARRIATEDEQKKRASHLGTFAAMVNPRVLALAVVYFGAVSCNYGVGFWLPQIVKSFGLTNTATGFITAIPYVVGTIGMIWFGRYSDRTLNRRRHVATALVISAGGIAISTLLDNPSLKILALSISAFGVFASLSLFWTLPTAFLTGASAAAGIAVINSVGNLSGFSGPYAMGWMKDQTGSYSGGLLLIAGCAVVALIIVLVLRHDSRLERPPEGSVLAEKGSS